MIERFREAKLGYFIIPIYVMALYIGTISSYIKFNNRILPSGDPFSYTLGFFRILDVARNNYLDGLLFALQSNFYWLINLMVAIFSPILVKEPVSISVINFIAWGIASASFYRLGLHLKLGFKFSLFFSLIIWIYPINFGFLDHSSIPVLALDAMFLGFLHIALANTIIFSIEPKSYKNMLIAAISIGLSIWGRGNSAPVVFLVVFIPLLVLIYKMFTKDSNRRITTNLILFATIISAMGFIYYYMQYAPIKLYYSAQKDFVERHAWNLRDALPFLVNVPGFFFWRVENSIATIGLSILMHLLVISSLLINIRKISFPPKDHIAFLSVIGGFIYFATYFISILLFTDPLITLHNCLLIYAPMRIGLSLCLMTIIISTVQRFNIEIKNVVVYGCVIFIIYCGATLSRKLTPEVTAESLKPSEVEAFSIKLGDMVHSGGVSILWYSNYNPKIINYFRRKNNLPEIQIYSGKYYNDLWAPLGYTEEKRLHVREEIVAHFENADLIIIPEYLDYYDRNAPYPLYRFKDEILKYLNSTEAPRFAVRMIIQENVGRRLLVLQRAGASDGAGELLKLPYLKSKLAIDNEREASR
ncbi:MAG: hypothetical protein A3F16_00660 [Deltaproteobacteria bacterium RIFCSPHIGHO2_12_FULL_43_9]|nr:MAG: hypothetical protein A3F16_00660 [Deltaproteobacteria bacterium RIFCSPHIGHO2_12_FULL_43_9]